MIFNFNHDHYFSTRLYLDETPLNTTKQTKLLGTIISTDLKWHSNTDMIVKKAYQRMIMHLRSVLEQSCQVWHHSITLDETEDLERVQKVACKVILKTQYTDYDTALTTLNLENLSDRRDYLCLKFAKKCLNNKQTKDMFPLNPTEKPGMRNPDKYQVQKSRTARLLFSAIPQMQRALNRANKYILV